MNQEVSYTHPSTTEPRATKEETASEYYDEEEEREIDAEVKQLSQNVAK